MPVIDLTGRTVLVTGGSRGIGAVTVDVLQRAGATVLSHSRSGDLAFDLAEPGAGGRLWDAAVERAGRIDVLVANAGIALTADLDDPGWDRAWRDTLQVNLIAVADLCRGAIGHFRQHGGGTVITVSSRSGQRGDSVDSLHYAASKAGVIALMKSIARGYARDGIRAYAIAPGWVATEMADALMTDPGAIARELPMGAIAPPEDVANTIAFLASGLAPHLTGATLDINGASYTR